mmetsp:Transcript_133681/g.303193  ORF Transcript_133681/g.303193 Transcript_133681/m.303193 type:complete len:204 (+) Transcript_133681:1387-1998(+)
MVCAALLGWAQPGGHGGGFGGLAGCGSRRGDSKEGRGGAEQAAGQHYALFGEGCFRTKSRFAASCLARVVEGAESNELQIQRFELFGESCCWARQRPQAHCRASLVSGGGQGAWSGDNPEVPGEGGSRVCSCSAEGSDECLDCPVQEVVAEGICVEELGEGSLRQRDRLATHHIHSMEHARPQRPRAQASEGLFRSPRIWPGR